jgi:hypothetical protein
MTASPELFQAIVRLIERHKDRLNDFISLLSDFKTLAHNAMVGKIYKRMRLQIFNRRVLTYKGIGDYRVETNLRHRIKWFFHLLILGENI